MGLDLCETMDITIYLLIQGFSSSLLHFTNCIILFCHYMITIVSDSLCCINGMFLCCHYHSFDIFFSCLYVLSDFFVYTNMECGFYVACMATSIVCVCPCHNCLSYTIILFSSVEYTDVSAYRLSLSEDTKALNQLVCGFCFFFLP